MTARPPLRWLGALLAVGAALTLGALALPAPRASSAGGGSAVAGPAVLTPSPTIGAARVAAARETPAGAPLAAAPGAVVLDGPPVTPALAAPAPVSTTVPGCRAAVLVHGGGYFFGDPGALDVSWAEPLRQAGLRVWNVAYPMLPDMPDVVYDPAEPWYPRPDVGSTPASLRVVHDRATDAVAPAVAEALATGCRVTLVGVSAGGSIVADLAHRFPQVHEAVLVAGASITPDRMGGAPLRIFYGALDEVVLPAASLETCERWSAAGSVCGAVGLAGERHVAPALTDAALAHVLADA